jgi:predicted nucleic acid-binding protein
MKVLVDTSAILAVALKEPLRDAVVSLTTECDLLAPEVLPYEIGNALTGLFKRGLLNLETAMEAWKQLQGVPIDLKPVGVPGALRIAAKYKLYAYDAYFLESSVHFGVPLLTLDKRMKAVARDLGITLME